MRIMKVFLSACFLSILMLVLIGWGETVQSQERYPTQPIDIIVPFPAGGSTDLSTRVTAAYLNKKWGVPVNVVNKPGGKCLPGTLDVYRAKPDGYTVLADSGSSSSILGKEVKDLPFGIMDRTFIGIVSTTPFMLIVPSTSSFKTLEDFIIEAKKNPQSISWTGGSPGNEVVTRQLFREIGIDISKTRVVPTQGGSQAVILTAGGNVVLGTSTVTTILPAVKAGTVRPLLITSKNRYPELPDVRTTLELGYPNVNAEQWVGISGPPKLPSSVTDAWDKTLENMVKDKEYISKLKNAGAVPFYLNAQATKELVKKEIEDLAELFR